MITVQPSGFVPMPSDPSTPLTEEQLAALFPNPSAWRAVVERVLSAESSTPTSTTDHDVRSKGAA